MPYSAEQIGGFEHREFTSKTRDRVALIVIQHGHAQGRDETQIVVSAPVSWPAGRRRTLEMVSRGIDLNDIRAVVIPKNYVGSAVAAGDGERLRPASYFLWWTVRDDVEMSRRNETAQEYASRIVGAYYSRTILKNSGPNPM